MKTGRRPMPRHRLLSEVIQVRVRAEVADRVHLLALRSGRSAPEVVRSILDSYFRIKTLTPAGEDATLLSEVRAE